MFGYIYKTTNLISGKCYIGKHKAVSFEGTNYLGSGKALKLAIGKYGKENFKVELLESCDTEDQLNNKEEEWIEKFNAVSSAEFYNIVPYSTGGNVWEHYPKEKAQKIFKEHSEYMKNFKHSEETKLKMSIQRKGKKHSEETKHKISVSNKGKRLGYKESSETIEKHRASSLNHKHSEESKKKISISNKGKRLGVKVSLEIRQQVSNTFRVKDYKWMSNQHEIIRVEGSKVRDYLNKGYKLQRKLVI